MKYLIGCAVFAGFVTGGMVSAQTVTDGEVFSTDSYIQIESMLVSAGGKVFTSSVAAIGGLSSYFSELTVTGAGSLLEANGVYMEGRGSRLLIQSGGVVRSTSSLGLYGDSTEGIVYPDLINSISITGNGSLLDIAGNLSLWSPDSPGGPGLPFDLPREIPTYLTVSGGGTVAVGGTLSVANGSWLSLGSGGRLEVANFIGDLTVHGTLAPGNSPGDSIVDGGLTLAPDGTLEMELGGYAPGGEYDRLTVTGLSTLDGILDIISLNSFSATNGASFDLFNWEGGVDGKFVDINTPTLSGELEWDTSDLYTTGTLSVIPEPSVMALLGFCGGGLWVIRKIFPAA